MLRSPASGGSSSSGSGSGPKQWYHDPALVKTFLLLGVTAGLCFYVGIMSGIHFGYSQGESECNANIQKAVNKRLHLKVGETAGGADADGNPLDSLGGLDHGHLEPRFEEGLGSFVKGVTATHRNMFLKHFDMGVPLEHTNPKNHMVLIVHTGEESLPSNAIYNTYAKSNTNIPYMDSPIEATENCNAMNVVFMPPFYKDQCIAIMGQYNSYHLQHYMRVPLVGGNNNSIVEEEERTGKHPLRLVAGNTQHDGKPAVHIPPQRLTKDYWKQLNNYLLDLDDTLEELKPLAEKVAIKNTVIVMILNFGQTEFLHNFACSCKDKNINTKSILVFATDPETKEVAKGLGFTSYHDEKTYHKFPKESAFRYGDKTFVRAMLAKLYCVHMMTTLGYNVLFQDVDLIWYRHPLEYFMTDLYSAGDEQAEVEDEEAKHAQFDIYVQEDGNRAQAYAPYSANSGFYFVRANERTRYFFSSLLMMGDLVMSVKSHQVAFNQLLASHSSYFGLKVKVLSATEGKFPGGWTFHSHKKIDYMKNLLTGKFKGRDMPYIFHMSWTHSKQNKIKFFKQMAQWHVKTECIGLEANKILAKHAGEFRGGMLEKGYLLPTCCLAKPQFECFYKDKPSVSECKNSPAIDKGGKSFW